MDEEYLKRLLANYRGLEWIETIRVAGVKRSMGRKGNSGDNAAYKGFFGRMKTEMFYGRKCGECFTTRVRNRGVYRVLQQCPHQEHSQGAVKFT